MLLMEIEHKKMKQAAVVPPGGRTAKKPNEKAVLEEAYAKSPKWDYNLKA
jgi:hypothetical protein